MTLLVPWLLTYLVHSTALLGASALVCLALRRRRLVLQEALVRAALVGGFVTASVPLALGVEPLGGAWHLGVGGASRPASFVVTAASDADAARPGQPLEAGSRRTVVLSEGTPVAVWVAAPSWTSALAAAWAALALLALARLGVAAARLRRLLRSRQPIQSVGLHAHAAAVAAGLGLRRAVRLSRARDLPVPLATGVVRPEVCLPERTLTELEDDEQLALCAHELAHVARRDPAWILLARLVEAAAPLQPLNLWARRRLNEVAECLSDDLAVAVSGRSLGLARSLVDVASWTVSEDGFLPAVAPGALSARSGLRHRVERLMDPLHQPERPIRFALPVAAAAVLATALVTPAVFGSGPRASSTPAPVPQSEEVSKAEDASKAEDTKAEAATGADDAARAEAQTERALEELTARIEARSREHQRQIEALQAEIETQVDKALPREELERYEADVEGAARAVAQAERERVRSPSDGGAARAEAEKARERLDEARTRLLEAARAVRVPQADIRRLTEQARALAEAAAPTPEEREELRRLSEELARRSVDTRALDEEMGRLGRDLGRDLGREMSRDLARGALRETLSQLRETLHETTRIVQEALRSSRLETDQAMRSARDAMRSAREEAGRALRESGAAMRLERGEEAPEPPEPPEAPAPPGFSEAPEAPEAPPAPTAPKVDERSSASEAPAASEAPRAPRATEAPEAAEAPPERHN